MRVDVLTLFPEAFGGPLDVSIIKRAREAGLLDLHLHDIREHATDRHRTVDDQPFGGGHGMVMKVDVLDAALQAAQAAAEPPWLRHLPLPPGRAAERRRSCATSPPTPASSLSPAVTKASTSASSNIASTARSRSATTS